MVEWTDEDLASGRVSVLGRTVTPRKDGFNAGKRQRFLDALAETCSVEAAIAAAGTQSSLVYKRRRDDPGFAEAWVEALVAGYDAVEAKVLRWVLSGGEDGGANADGLSGGADTPGRQAAAETRGSGGGLVFGQAPGWVQVALHLLNRHRPTVEGRARPMRTGRTAAAEETDAVLTRRLDQLSRALARGAIKPVRTTTLLIEGRRGAAESPVDGGAKA